MYLKNEEDLGGLKCNCAFKIFKNCNNLYLLA